MRSLPMPPRCRIQAPSASPPAPLAGTSEPIPSSEPPICQLRRRDRPVQKIGPNTSPYEANERPSNRAARASQPGLASRSRSLNLAQSRRERDDRDQGAEGRGGLENAPNAAFSPETPWAAPPDPLERGHPRRSRVPSHLAPGRLSLTPPGGARPVSPKAVPGRPHLADGASPTSVLESGFPYRIRRPPVRSSLDMTGSVLVIDDDAMFRELARRILANCGLVVAGEAESAAAGRAAAAILKPRAALVDVMLPDGDGVALARELSALPWGPRVVLTSSSADAAGREEIDHSGAVAFVPKAELPGVRLDQLFGDG
jgi:CheY-like chemotaxis protein